MNPTGRKVLAAFQQEYPEYLERIRALVAEAERTGAPAAPGDLEEAFRQAHSLKGGARVCDLRPIETLAHRLEGLFARLQDGTLTLDASIRPVIRRTLDAIEDYMSAVGTGKTPADPVEATAAIERFLAESPEAPPGHGRVPQLKAGLVAAFQDECRTYLDAFRPVAAMPAAAPVPAAAVGEALRCAHGLKDASRIAEIRALGRLSDGLVRTLSRLLDGSLAPEQPVLDALQTAVEGIEQTLSQLAENRIPTEPVEAVVRIDRLLDGEPSAAAAAPADSGAAEPSTTTAQPTDAVRVGTADLDHLLRTTEQLLGETARNDLLEGGLAELGRRIGEMEREWEAVRNAAAKPLARMESDPEFAGISRFLGSLGKTAAALSRRTRELRVLHQRGGWSLRSLGRQLRESVRRVRLVPAESLFMGCRKIVRDLARDLGKEIDFQTDGLDAQADRLVLQSLKDPVMHMLRNAADHGIEHPEDRERAGKPRAGRIGLRIESLGNRLDATVEDDGRGVDPARIADAAVRRGMLSPSQAAELPREELLRLVFRSGFSTADRITDVSGRGIGLSVVQEAARQLQGDVHLRPRAGGGTAVTLSVPLSLSTHRLLLVNCRGQVFALPLHAIEKILRIKPQDIQTIEGRPYVTTGVGPVALAGLGRLLGFEGREVEADGGRMAVVILKAAGKRGAVAVDGLVAERSAVVTPLDGPAGRAPAAAGAVLLERGRVCVVLRPEEILRGLRAGGDVALVATPAARAERKARTILVVDDSFTTRTLEQSILELHGYRVRLAVDGAEALAALRTEAPDLVITDVQMPRMDGLTLLAQMKGDPRLSAIPVIVVSSMDRREDQERGLALGADAYIPKGKFDHQELVETIRQII